MNPKWVKVISRVIIIVLVLTMLAGVYSASAAGMTNGRRRMTRRMSPPSAFRGRRARLYVI